MSLYPECPICGHAGHPPLQCLAKALKSAKEKGQGLEPVKVQQGQGVLNLSFPPNQKGVVYLLGSPVSLLAPGPCDDPHCVVHGRRPGSVNRLPPLAPVKKLLTAEKVRARKKRRGSFPRCARCRARAFTDRFLDYTYCPRCKTALSESQVNWKIKRVKKKADRDDA